MGLDTTPDAWHGAYSAFSRWRDQLARTAGYELAKLDGNYRESVLLDWGHMTDSNLMGEWDATPADALLVLIVHSDCDGAIYPPQAAALADRLTELLPLLPEGEGGGHIGNWRDCTERFINGLRAADAAGEPLEFH